MLFQGQGEEKFLPSAGIFNTWVGFHFSSGFDSHFLTAPGWILSAPSQTDSFYPSHSARTAPGRPTEGPGCSHSSLGAAYGCELRLQPWHRAEQCCRESPMGPLPSLAPLLCLPAMSCQTDAACPQQGLCLVRGRNEPFQQWSQLVKALGSIQTPAVVTQGGLPTHKRGFGSGCSAQGGLSGSGAASERAGKNIWGGRGLGHEATGCPAHPSMAAGRSGTLRGSVPAQCARHRGGDVNPCMGHSVLDRTACSHCMHRAPGGCARIGVHEQQHTQSASPRHS